MHALFIGRWRTFHNGHLWLIRQKADQGIPVLIAIRPTDETPTVHERYLIIQGKLRSAGITNYKIMVLPVDIESVNYGRDVGYDVTYHEPPAEIAAVSATKILQSLPTSGNPV